MTVVRRFIAEFSLHYIALQRTDSLCKSNALPMKYLAGLNIWNVANTAATNSVAVMQTRPAGEPFSTTAETSRKFPLILICCFAASVGKGGTSWDYDSKWGAPLWSAYLRVSVLSLTGYEEIIKKKTTAGKKNLIRLSPNIQAMVEGKRLCVRH